MLQKSIQHISGIGPKKIEVLKTEAGIETIEDLLYYAPRKFLDRSSCKTIKNSYVNEIVTVAGIITKVIITGKYKKILEVVIDDSTDTLSGIFFGGISYIKKFFNIGDHVLFSGKIDFYQKKQIIHPDFDFLDDDSQIKSINTGRIIPLYRSTENLKKLGFDSRGFRKIIRIAIDEYLQYINDPLDSTFLENQNLISLKDAIFNIHFPESIEKSEIARKRLSFNELFFLQYYFTISKKYLKEELKQNNKKIDLSLYKKFLVNLSFTLTADQKKSIRDIYNDLKNPFPMNRLLHGDVGSGKTIVAMASSLFAIGGGVQVAVMVPTEVLAYQHYENFKKFFPQSIKIFLLTGNIPKNEKNIIYDLISKGKIDIVIGTHALIQEKVSFQNLGLIIIDEQHRFGVNQRARLREKGKAADLLVITATPIPRSLTLTLYGDLDVSNIREKPAFQVPVKTLSFPESRIKAVYNSVEKYLNQERQVFFVLPIIKESEKMDLKSAIEVYNNLKSTVFTHRRVEILHGKMPQPEKNDIMRRFIMGEIDILVATTVIEVGIDVPNVNTIVIQHAERFGLSQLHQLRGRVGRGKHQAYCVLIYPDNISTERKKRIDAIVSENDGFKIAEADLTFRGAGEIFGTRQHGHSIGFEFTDLVKDIELISSARYEAEKRVSDIKDIKKVFKNMKKETRYVELLKGIRTKRVLSILS